MLLAIFSVLEIWIKSSQSALGRQRGHVDRQLTLLKKDLSGLRGNLSALNMEMADFRLVHDQPDWSVLARALAKTLGNDVMLEECAVASTADPNRPADPNAGFTLSLVGQAKDQGSVWAYAMRLEKTGLFRQVRPPQTEDKPFMESRAVEFRMQCALDGKVARR